MSAWDPETERYVYFEYRVELRNGPISRRALFSAHNVTASTEGVVCPKTMQRVTGLLLQTDPVVGQRVTGYHAHWTASMGLVHAVTHIRSQAQLISLFNSPKLIIFISIVSGCLLTHVDKLAGLTGCQERFPTALNTHIAILKLPATHNLVLCSKRSHSTIFALFQSPVHRSRPESRPQFLRVFSTFSLRINLST